MAWPVLILACIFISLYLWVVYAEVHILDFWQKRLKSEAASLRAVLTEKYAGFMLLGVLPLLMALAFPQLFTLKFRGDSPDRTLTLLYSIGFGALAVLINFFRAGKPANYALYPKARLSVWKPLNWIAYEMGWVFYLLGYEWLFRGFMFFPLVDEWGFWPATLINIVLYVLAHLPKGWLEMAGSVPFGLLLCWVAYSSGSFMAPWVIHCCLALSNSYFAIRANPEMRFGR